MQTSYLKNWAEKRKRQRYTKFPDEVSGPVTIYIRYTDILTGNQTNIRRVLQNSFWNPDSISIFRETGNQIVNNISLYIPYHAEVTGYTYITPEEWNNLPASGMEFFWTIDPKNLPIVISGSNEHEFEWAAPNATNRITIQDNNFLNLNPTAKRLADVNTQFYGSPDMWHIECRA